MLLDYFSALGDMATYCANFRDWVLRSFFTSKTQQGQQRSDTPTDSWNYYGHFCYDPEYQRRLEMLKRCIQICHVFNIAKLTAMQPGLLERAYVLGRPEIVKARKEIEANIEAISTGFLNQGFQIAGMIRELHSSEVERMLEAVHDLFENCRMSAVAMAASAIEFRLLEFMKKLTPQEDFEKETLGSLIQQCLDPDKPYFKRLPDRHRPLLELCNKYRIFSVHPSTTPIGQNEALSVINLAFSFILDPQVRKVSVDAVPFG
jgi:hypothetical protein